MENTVGNLSDHELLKQCEEFGRAAILARQKFIGLLPEVNRRELYKKKGFGSIFEFAYKLAGLSEKQVRLAINLDERFCDKPTLKQLLESGDVSISKISRAVSIATPENEAELAKDLKNLPRKAFETRVRDIKNGCDKVGNGLTQPLSEQKSMPGHKLQFEFSDEIVDELNQLNMQGQDMNKVMKEMLETRKKEIQQKKEKLSSEVKQTDSRYVQKKVRDLLAEEYGTKCSMPGCKKLAAAVHHTLPFAVAHVHDPEFMVPLCQEHHQIAHLVNLKYAEKFRH